MILEYLLIFYLKNSNLFKKNLTNLILGINSMVYAYMILSIII